MKAINYIEKFFFRKRKKKLSNRRQLLQFVVYPFRVRNHSKEFLLLKRTEERGGFWQGVVGWPENNEKLTIAALRELKQQTGLEPLWIEEMSSYPVFTTR